MIGPEREDLLGRLVPTPGPRSAHAAQVWAALDPDRRRRLRRAAVHPTEAALLDDPDDRAVVADLADQRASWRWTDVAAAVATGLLVLSTIWGFGRAVFPDSANSWLVVGLAALALTTLAGLRRVAARREAACRVLHTIEG